MLIVVVMWLFWYVCSLGWPRYATIGVAVGALPVARMLVDLRGWLRGRKHMALWLAATIATAAIILVPLARTVTEMAQPDRSVLHFAAYIDRVLKPSTMIETWEPELGGLTAHQHHYPPQALLDVAVRHQWEAGPQAHYDLEQMAAPYVAIGPFATWTGIYAPEQLAQRYRLLHRDGPYALYQRLP